MIPADSASFKMKREGKFMRRKVFDVLVSAGGLLVVAVLVVAGALLMWAQSFTNSSVHNQLAQQDIFFPAKADITPAQRPYLLQYAGQQVLTGAQASAYAQKIESDVAGMPYGGVYAKISAAALANPNNAALKAEATTAFEGTTLRGLLLEAYAFGTFGTIALWAGNLRLHPGGTDAHPRPVRLLALKASARSRRDPRPRSQIASSGGISPFRPRTSPAPSPWRWSRPPRQR